MRPPLPSMMLSRRAKIALSVVGIVIVLIVVLLNLAGVYINYLWFGELGHRGVYSTILWTRVVLFVVFGALMALIIGGNLVAAYLIRPPFRPMSAEQQNLQNYVLMIEPRRRLVLVAVMAVAFLGAGASAQGDWAAWQLFFNGGSFGVKDAQFNMDVSFYAWDYPVYRLLLGFGFTAVIFSIILSVGVHYLSGAIRLQTPGPKMTIAARRHITVLVFVFMAMKAVAYWLDRYGLVFSDRSKFTGASYTDVHSLLPAKTILFWITIILALGVLGSIWLRSALLPGIGFVVLLVLSILISGIYPAIVQQVSVKPNASDKEARYILRNIDATRQAYGIVTDTAGGTVHYTDYPVASSPDPAALTPSDATIANIRILDPNVLSPTFAQQQAQKKNFYDFPPKLDVDRYSVNGVTSDYIVGVRELNKDKLTGTQTNWINQHTNYTHGYGFVAAAANKDVTADKSYADGDIPQSGPLQDAYPLKVPQVYYGELVSDYAVVGAKGEPREFDGAGNAKVTYTGKGGISLSSVITKLAFAVDDKETSFLLNDAVGAPGARVMINRDPRLRVEKLAPFLKADGDPYPIVDTQSGHIVWMVDAYTTMANFPYAQREQLSDLTSSSLTQTKRTAGQSNTQINYIRNSVKATVDAYDGTVKLYQWDTKDPVLKAWMGVFPGLISPGTQMPKTIKAHIRYPEDLFEVQRSLLEQYHVDNPVTFYNVGDKWTVPSDPAPNATGDQPPYYVLADAQDGSSSKPVFQLTSPMKVNDKTNLAAFITVNSDPGEDYGKMTVLKLTSSGLVQGPEQVANSFQSTDVISTNIGQLGQGSKVVHGNLLTLPIGESFLYVEPLYVQAANSSGSVPILRRILTLYGDRIGYAETVANALTDLQAGHRTGESLPLGVGGSGGGSSTSSPPPTSTTTTPSTPSTSSPGTGTTAPPGVGVQALLGQLNTAYRDLTAAYASQDQAKIGAAQQKVNQLVQQLVAAESKGASSSPSR